MRTPQTSPRHRSVLAALLLAVTLAGANPARGAELITLADPAPALSARLQRAGDWPDGSLLILLHGTLSHRDTEIIESLETLFLDEGISTLAINLSLGVEQRDGAFPCDQLHRHREDDASGELLRWLDWLDSQGVAESILLGHSRGARQAARFVLDSADRRVSQLVLVAPPRWSARGEAAAYRERHGRDLPKLLSLAEHTRQQHGPQALLPEPVGLLYCDGARVSADSFLSYYRPDTLRDTPTLLQRLTLPVLVIGGSEDRISSGLAEAFESAADNVRNKAGNNVRYVEIDGADHFFRDLYADELVEIAVDFLDQ